MTSSGHYTFLPITFDRIELETWESEIGHVAYVSMRLDETDLVTPFSRLKLYFLKLLCKKLAISP